MKKYTYIQKDTESIYVELDFELSSEQYTIGTTWDDYCDGLWVLLTDEQLDFKSANPNASVEEVFKIELAPVPEPPKPHIPTLDEVKQEKIYEIMRYDYSPSVNNFKINGEDSWLDKSTRVGLMNAIQIEKAAGKPTVTLWFNNVSYIVPCDLAIGMLSQLEQYALACFNVTAEHKNKVGKLTTIDDVNAYDYTVGYPEQLAFEIAKTIKDEGGNNHA